MKDIKKDLGWLKNRLKNFKRINIHESDIKALNNIIDYYNESKIPKKTPTEEIVRKLLIHIISNKIKSDTYKGDDKNFGLNLTNHYLKGIISKLEFLLNVPEREVVTELTIAMNNMRLFNNIKLLRTKKLYDEKFNSISIEVENCDVDIEQFEMILRTEWKVDEVEKIVDDLLTQIFDYNL